MRDWSPSHDRKGLGFPLPIPRRKMAFVGEGLALVPDTPSSARCTSKAEVSRPDWDWARAMSFRRDNTWTRLGSEPIHPYLIFVDSLRESKATASTQTPKEDFRGRVDNIRDGIAFVTLFSDSGEKLVAQWPEEDLAQASIGKGDLFELTMTDVNGQITSSFRKLKRKMIPDDLWSEIEELRVAYAHLLDDQGDASEESR